MRGRTCEEIVKKIATFEARNEMCSLGDIEEFNCCPTPKHLRILTTSAQVVPPKVTTISYFQVSLITEARYLEVAPESCKFT